MQQIEIAPKQKKIMEGVQKLAKIMNKYTNIYFEDLKTESIGAGRELKIRKMQREDKR